MTSKTQLKPKYVYGVLLLIIIVRIAVMFGLDHHTYWTFDEPWNTETARQVLVEKQFRRTKDSFTPISILNVFVGDELLKEFPDLDKLTALRVAGILFNQAAVPLLYVMALQLGASAGVALLFTVFLSFEPNLLGHTILASNVDGYIFTWFTLLAVCAFYWVEKKNLVSAGLFGLALGLAQGVKLTSAYAVPLCLLWFGYVLFKRIKTRRWLQFFVFLLMSWVGLNLFYAFNKLGTPLGAIHFISPPFIKFAAKFPKLPTIVPVDYLQGLDMCLNTDAIPRPVFIMNRYFMHGVWYYFLYALLLKTPLPLLITAAAGWIVAIRKKTKFTDQQKFLVLFIAFFMFYFSLMLNAQVGVRYLFPIYGFMLAGMLWFRWRKPAVLLTCVWMAFSFWYNWPNFIGYFNELVPVKHHRWWHLGDSNLTWNQEWYDWVDFMGKRKLTADQTGPVTLPLNLPFYEDAITVAGVLRNRDQLALLRDNFEPFDSFWGVKLEYLITPDEILKAFPAASWTGPMPPGPLVCGRTGFTDEKGGHFDNLNIVSGNPVGTHSYSASFKLAEATPVFFEMSSKKPSSATLNGQPLLRNDQPVPKLIARTLLLQPGSYQLAAVASRDYPDDFFSFRALDVSKSGKGRPLEFCSPLTPQAR